MHKREYLLEQLQHKIGDFQTDSARHKRLYRRLRYALFALTALSALLAGVALQYPASAALCNLLILLVSVLIGLLTSIEGLRKPAELWIHERSCYYALLDLRREVEFHAEADEARLDAFFLRLQEILGSSGEQWSGRIVGATLQSPDSQPATAMQE